MKILLYSAVIVVTLCITLYNVLNSDIHHAPAQTNTKEVQNKSLFLEGVSQDALESSDTQHEEMKDPSESLDHVVAKKIHDAEVAVQENTDTIKTSKSDNESSIPKSAPFISQAPTAQWELPMYQDGCEEATITMALGWAQKTPAISKEEAVKSIQDITAFTTKKFGHFTSDTSAYDTAQIINEYTPVLHASIHEKVSLKEIKNILRKDVVIAVPLIGQLLKDPHFTGKGPLHHMLLIIGYDNKTKEFIVNDPGTRVGASYRYPEDILYSTLRDYATGNHEVDSDVNKNIIVIQKTEEKTKEIEGAIQKKE